MPAAALPTPLHHPARLPVLCRYVMWGHATPVMLYALSMISDFTSQQVVQTMVVDVIMIATVVPGELIPGGCGRAGRQQGQQGPGWTGGATAQAGHCSRRQAGC